MRHFHPTHKVAWQITPWIRPHRLSPDGVVPTTCNSRGLGHTTPDPHIPRFSSPQPYAKTLQPSQLPLGIFWLGDSTYECTLDSSTALNSITNLIAAAIQAPIHAKAPRRTVAAVAAAVAGAFARPAAARAAPTTGGMRLNGVQCAATQLSGSSPEELLESLRAHRRVQRNAKKERRNARKVAVSHGR